MVKKETDIIRNDQYLTESKFAEKYGFKTKEQRAFVTAAFRVLYKMGLHAKNPAGNMVQIIQLNRKSHSINSRYKVPPYFEERVLQEIKKQEKIAAAKAKAVEK